MVLMLGEAKNVTKHHKQVKSVRQLKEGVHFDRGRRKPMIRRRQRYLERESMCPEGDKSSHWSLGLL